MNRTLELEDKTSEEIILELQVNQIELKIRNEEFIKVLEVSTDNYQDLYDVSPVRCVAICHSDFGEVTPK